MSSGARDDGDEDEGDDKIGKDDSTTATLLPENLPPDGSLGAEHAKAQAECNGVPLEPKRVDTCSR